MPRTKVIRSIFRRNFSSYFSGVIGYLCIIAFVVAGAALAFNGRFFTSNEPNLDQLSAWYPLLLLFIIPAITMSIWADEKKAGTDELLFTMPATDAEILLGKYFSVLAVYTVALLFSLSHVFVLAFLGNPDWGLIATTYVGYWMAGAALCAAGMLASVLTSNAAVAFVLGVLFCGLPVFIGQLGGLLGFRELFEELSLSEQLRDFSLGIVPLSGVAYFLCFSVFMLFVNMIMIGKRHWRSSQRSSTSLQFAIRAVCVAVMLSCATSWASYTAVRVDATSEQLFSLTDTTRNILDELEPERPIEIQAFLSPEVPREYVDTRKQLVGMLRQFDELGGNKLQVRYVDVEPFSEQAEEAEHFGIEPQRVVTERDGRRSEADVYLGAVVISSYDKVTVPFFGKGLPIEYELTRSVQTVAEKERHTVGVLSSDTGLTGSREWQIVSELKKQYKVKEVSPSSEIDADEFDVLMAVLPSSLTAPEMDNLVDYVKGGNPTLIFDDPFPMTLNNGFGITNAPRQSKSSGGGMGMGMMGRGAPGEAKADGGRASRLTRALGISWNYDQVVFDANNPHPEFANLPYEYVFATRDNNKDAFSSEHVATSGLQEIITLYSGTVAKNSLDEDRAVEFTPLITTSAESGILRWNEFVDEGGFNMFSMQPTANPKRNPVRRMDGLAHVIAAQVKSEKEDDKLNAIYVADIDMISDFFFNERNLGNLDIEFDNVSFVLNAVDSLVGDDSFIELRSRRAKHRTLTRVESQKRVFLEEANRAEAKSDAEATAELARRREELGKRVKEIRENDALDPIAKAQMLKAAQQAEQQRFSLAEAQIEQRKNDEVRKIRAQTNRQIKTLESRIRGWATWLPAIPAMLMGLVVFFQRSSAEKNSIIRTRRRDTNET